jgi:hypothetical protein
MKGPAAAKRTGPIASTGAAVLSTFALIGIPGVGNSTEEPEYQVVRKFSAFEVRQYPGYTVAEIVVPGPAGDAGNQAFPVLAGYIFGKNKGARKFAMTAPVTQEAAPVKLPMTAPVSQVATPGGYLVQFVLPKGVAAADAPEPVDTRIKLRNVPPGRIAVIRFSGSWSQSNYDEHLATLRAALKVAALVESGEPIYSRYNPPFTPWFMRRNEIWLRLKDGGP